MRLSVRRQSVPTNIRPMLEPLKLTEDDFALFFEILTSQHSNMVGVFLCTKWYLCSDLKWNPERVEKSLSHLMELKLVYNDERLGILMIDPSLGMNPIDEFRSPSQIKGAMKVMAFLPPSKIYKPLIAHLEALKRPWLKPIQRKLNELIGRRDSDD